MVLKEPTPEHLQELRSWFTNTEAITSWGGPKLHYPNTLSEFQQCLSLETLRSFALVSNHTMLGFGQYYERLGHCHLGRLAIAPQHRGKGTIEHLIQLLRQHGQPRLNVSAASLFVLRDNAPAIKAYQKLGFKETRYPGEMGIENCLYMTNRNRV